MAPRQKNSTSLDGDSSDSSSDISSSQGSISKPNWRTWKRRRTCSIQDAVALSFNVYPGDIDKLTDDTVPTLRKYKVRLKTLRSALDHDLGLKSVSNVDATVEEPFVDLREFVAYCIKENFSALPDGFRNLSPQGSEMSQLESKLTSVEKLNPRKKNNYLRIMNDFIRAAIPDFDSRKSTQSAHAILAWYEQTDQVCTIKVETLATYVSEINALEAHDKNKI